MIGSRFAVICLLLSQLLGVAAVCWGIQRATHSELTFIQQQIKQGLQSLERFDVEGYDTLASHYPVRFMQLIRGVEQRWSVGKFTPSSHWLSPLLNKEIIQHTYSLDDIDVHVSLNSDAIMSQYTAPLAFPALFILGSNLCLLGLFLYLGQKARRNLALIESAIVNLPSLEIASDVMKLNGPFRKTSRQLISARDQLKQQIGAMQKNSANQVQHALTDPVTQLANRASFNQDMEHAQRNNQSGQLILLRAAGLEEINQRMGKQAGDNYLATMGTYLRQLVSAEDRLSLYRYASTDFLLRFPTAKKEEVLQLMRPIALQLSQLAEREGLVSSGNIGITAYQGEDRLSQLLVRLDTAISIAQSEGPNSYYYLDANVMEFDVEKDLWLEVVEDVIQQSRVEFTQQQVLSLTQNKPMYLELLARFTNKDGNPLPTQTLFAMAGRANRIVELDRLLFSQAIKEVVQQLDHNISYGINISSHAAADSEYLSWIEERVARTPELHGRLVLEITEQTLDFHTSRITKWINRMHQYGVRIAVERFGNGLTSFRSLQTLKPDYVKLDPIFTKEIEENSNNRFFIKMLMDIAVRLEIRVIATHVERYEERIVLEELCIDGIQGHLIASPQPLTTPVV